MRDAQIEYALAEQGKSTDKLSETCETYAALTIYTPRQRRRMRAKLGAPKAIAAAAHKLARIVYRLLTHREPYDATVFVRHEKLWRARAEAKLRAQARTLGLKVIPVIG